jgi:rubrerythrin
MASFDEVELVLLEAKAMEKKAEDNCAKILEIIEKNGRSQVIDKIKNDEIRHQGIVDELLKLLKKT